ncbi:MAG: peptide-methionine (S)-S-oxide reductase MsrA [Anaerolineae bacterium]|nr:peptide-methionine (S)-S-oxide reductase MsrA [Anaerolineae bacterium]
MNQLQQQPPALPSASGLETATLAGGCFWCLEAVFGMLRGIKRVASRYAGGRVPNPTYKAVCLGTTGHAEAVQITFDPAQISYRDLLDVFFTTHDPTTLNRQGADVGTQYRSAIFFHSPAQKATAEAAMAEVAASGLWPDPLVTELAPADPFFAAEDYHQDYYANNTSQGYCRIVIAPKVAKARKMHLAKLRS